MSGPSRRRILGCFAALLAAGCGSPAGGYDWPMYGRDASRNAVSPERNPPTSWSVKDGHNVRWKAKLGSHCFAPPVVSEGLVWVGTNNEAPRDPARKGDAGVLMCFRETDGAFLWQYVCPPSVRSHQLGEWGNSPLRCSPLVEGDRLWFITNRWIVTCLDIGPMKRRTGEPREVWKLDLIGQVGVEPSVSGMGFSFSSSIGASYRGMLYVCTGNGLNWEAQKPGKPDAPAVVCLDKETGEVLGREASGISARTVTPNWSSPVTVAVPDGRGGERGIVIFGGGDGFLYAFDATPAAGLLKELWRVDCAPAAVREGKERRVGIIATPVVHGGCAYACIGDEDASGPGHLTCVELTTGRAHWTSEKVSLTLSSPVVCEGAVYTAGTDGFLYCLDAATGGLLWEYDLLSATTCAPLLVDGLLYVATPDPEMHILDVSILTGRARRLASPVKVERAVNRVALVGEGGVGEFLMGPQAGTAVRRLRFPDGMLASPIFANGSLIAATDRWIYSIRREGRDATDADTTPVKRGRAPEALFVPTPQDVVERMLEAANVTRDDVVYDLGSGDGRVVLTAAQKFGARAVGYEIDRALVEESRKAIGLVGLEDRARVEYEDLLKADLSDATIVTLYIGRRLNDALVPKLLKLKPGARVVSHNFPIRGLADGQILKVKSTESGKEHTLHLWTAPLRENR